jgi:aerobic carbon-monoxide dehydrogenase large subunit
MAGHSPSEGWRWIGASLLRKEDARHLLGHGMFIADVRMPGMQDIAFVRSQMAHAAIRQVTKPEADAGSVFTLDDISPLHILEAGPELAAHRHSPYPALSDGIVRYAGQPVAACMKPTRALAEDLADQVRWASIFRNCPRWSTASRRCGSAVRGCSKAGPTTPTSPAQWPKAIP